MKRPTKTNFPLKFRSREQYRKIKNAAGLTERGNMTQFILDAAERRADAILERAESAELAEAVGQRAVNQ